MDGQIVLFNFPQTDLAEGKLRPALLLGRFPGPYDDWLTGTLYLSELLGAVLMFIGFIRATTPMREAAPPAGAAVQMSK